MAQLCEYNAPIRRERRTGLWRNGLGGAWTLIGQIGGTAGGGMMIAAGLVFVPLPIPLGVPLLALGSVLLWRSCPPARAIGQSWLDAHPRAHGRLRAVARRLRLGWLTRR